MKRIRAIDVPKFRRPVKSTRARLGESVYFNPGGFVYAKLILMWVSCILLDLLIGFRIELLWPIWLMIRHLYDAYRVQNFVSSFHYSAFSIFFVCITVTSDLICYLFVPVQVLVFIASTYVWIQFVYQSTERGLCTPTFLLWGLFVGFEYVVRSRPDQSTFYLTRGSWVTAGMFSTDGTDNIFVGNSEDSLSRFEVYKAFASHCLGFPLVTLGVRVKSYFSSWRLKRRKADVMNQNEFYYRLLADAQPAPYDPRIATAKQLALDNADFEIDDENVSECGSVITSQPTVCASTALNGASNGTLAASTLPVSTNTAVNRKSRNTAPKSTVPTKSQNGYSNGAVCTKRNGRAATGTASKRDQNEETEEAEPNRQRSFSLVRLPIFCFWLTHFICRSAYDFILSPLWRVLASQLSSTLKLGKPTKPDDLTSNSGEGSMLAEEETDRDEFGNLKSNDGSSKRRSKRARGRTPAVAEEIVTSRTLSQQQLKPQATIAPSFATKPLMPEIETCNVHNPPVQQSALQQNGNVNGQLHETDKQDPIQQNGRIKEKSKSQEKCKCSIKVDDLETKLRVERGNSRQQIINMEREKEILEQALDNLRSEMHQLRTNETTVRAELSLVQNQERSQRSELNQLRSKLNDAEQRVAQANRQLDRLKKETVQQQTKRESVKVKRDDTRAGTPDQQQTSKEFSDLRLKVQNLEKELQTAQMELKNKQQAYARLEQHIKDAELGPKTGSKEEESGVKNYQQQIEELQQKNARLEKTLLSENKLKIDLFRALTNSKAQLEHLTSQKRETEPGTARNGFESVPANDLNNTPVPSSLASLVNGYGSGSSSPVDRVSPSSSSSQGVLASNTAVTKSSTSINDELEQILAGNGQFSYFCSDGFASTATPSTNAAAQALAQQLKMSASPSLFNNNQSKATQQQQQSRSASPSTNELFNILNAKSISSSFGSYGLNNATTTASTKLNSDTVSPAFH